jgi:hypothetical protein
VHVVALDRECVNDHDWSAKGAQFFQTSPYNYAVLDNFLSPATCTEVRDHLIHSKGWGFMNVLGPECVLFVRNFDLPLVSRIATTLINCLPEVFGGLSLVEYSAFMNRENQGLSIHSDNGFVTLNIYMTPDEFNLDPNQGGTLLYDVKRGEHQSLHEFNAEPWSTEYFKQHTKGGVARIGYRFNRALLFDARTLHSAERMRFAGGGVGSHRLNLALRFDKPEQFQQRYQPYSTTASATTPVATRENRDALGHRS